MPNRPARSSFAGLLASCALGAAAADAAGGEPIADPYDNFVIYSGEALVNPQDIGVGDFDGDGVAEIVAYESDDDRLVLLDVGPDGLSAFGSLQIPFSSNPVINVGDWDGDGAMDISVDGGFGAVSIIFFGDGAGAFPTFGIVSFAGSYETDFYRLVVPHAVDGAHMLVATDTGLYAASIGSDRTVGPGTEVFQSFNGVAQFTVYDVDGDGIQDVVVSPFEPNAQWVRQREDGTWEEPALIPGIPRTWSVGTGDFNGDGVEDLIFMSIGEQYVVLGDVAGGLGRIVMSSDGEDPAIVNTEGRVLTHDVDRDGNLDVILVRETAIFGVNPVWFGDGLGGLAYAGRGAHAPSDAGIATGDLTGDGLEDLASLRRGTGRDQVGVQPGAAPNAFSDLAYAGGGGTRIAGDQGFGTPGGDYLFSRASRRLGRGGLFETVGATVEGATPLAVASDSMVGEDGKATIATIATIAGDRRAEVFTIDSPEATEAEGRVFSAFDQRMQWVRVTDVDDGGIPEVVVQSADGRWLRVYRPVDTGLEVVQTFEDIVPAPAADLMVIVDVDSDGLQDLVIGAVGEAGGTGGTWIGFGGDDGAFEPPVEIRPGGEAFGRVGTVAIDVDGDGVREIVRATSAEPPAFEVLVHDGNRAFSRRSVVVAGGVTSPARALVAADVDGDGRHELVAHDPVGGAVTVFFIEDMPGDPIFTGTSVRRGGLFAPSDRISVIDVNGDGRDDLRSSVRIQIARSGEPAAPCPADVDGDGTIGFGDLLAVLGAFGETGDMPEDVDGDGVVGFDDILGVLGAWGPCPNAG